jgi:hypothetical protein
MLDYYLNINHTKDFLVNVAENTGIPGAASMTKHNIIVCLFIKKCFDNNKYVGDYSWFRQSIGYLKKVAKEKRISVTNNDKHQILEKLFSHAYTHTVDDQMSKFSFLNEYQRLTSEMLDPVFQMNLDYDYEIPDYDYEIPETPITATTSSIATASSEVNDSYGEDVVVDQNNNSELTKELTCVVCATNKRAVVFSECKHFVTCNDCTKKLEKKCPVCRTQNYNVSRIFF